MSHGTSSPLTAQKVEVVVVPLLEVAVALADALPLLVYE